MTVDYGNQYGRIDVEALKQLVDTHITVIPCPGHKAEPENWVHKKVPLLGKAGKASLKATG